MEATTKDLRLHTRELISATDRGEQVVITYRGRPRAKLVPIEADVPSARSVRNPAFAIWKDREEGDSVDGVVRALRSPRSLA